MNICHISSHINVIISDLLYTIFLIPIVHSTEISHTRTRESKYSILKLWILIFYFHEMEISDALDITIIFSDCSCISHIPICLILNTITCNDNIHAFKMYVGINLNVYTIQISAFYSKMYIAFSG